MVFREAKSLQIMERASGGSAYLRAVEQDVIERYSTVLALYNESLRLLGDLIKETKNQRKKRQFREKADKYRDRAECIKTLIHAKKAGVKYRDQIRIEEGSTGYGYATVFGRFLDAGVTHIRVEDPYIRKLYQCQNLVRFCELCVQRCQSLRKITLLTGLADPDDRGDQKASLHELRSSLISRQVYFTFSFSTTLHDRLVKLDNGWVIKIGRGLNYFNQAKGRFILGSCDLELRPCWETTIDIYHVQSNNF